MPSNEANVAPAAKAGMLRGFAEAMRREGIYERVRAKVPPSVAALLDDPPPPSVWIENTQVEPIHIAIAEIVGLEGVRRISRAAVTLGLFPFAKIVIDGFLRLFGATPHTLLSRIGDLSKTSTRGIAYEYVRTSERTARLLVRYPAQTNVPISVFSVAAGGFESMIEATGAKGTVSEPAIVRDGRDNSAWFEIEWTPRGG
jgi:hypothetical protein